MGKLIRLTYPCTYIDRSMSRVWTFHWGDGQVGQLRVARFASCSKPDSRSAQHKGTRGGQHLSMGAMDRFEARTQ